MCKYNENASELDKRWEMDCCYKSFCHDGVVNRDPGGYFDSNVRILFLLKESYGGFSQIRGGNFSSRGGGDYSPKSRLFWKMLGFWTYAITEYAQKKCPQIETFEAMHRDGGYALVNVAYVNVKKTLGQSKSNWGEIEQYARDDYEYIDAQIALCRPNVIVTCGLTKSNSMYRIYNEVLCGGTLPNSPLNGMALDEQRECLVVSSLHPSCPVGATEAKKKEALLALEENIHMLHG